MSPSQQTSFAARSVQYALEKKKKKMSSQQRVALWAAEPDLDDEIHDVDIPLTLPSYPAADIYEDPNLPLDEDALQAMQAQIAQQTAFSQIPDVVKRVSLSIYPRLVIVFDHHLRRL